MGQRQHAVVLGASMAGLAAARALCEHFERVTLVERDALGDVPGKRKGVPQGDTRTACSRVGTAYSTSISRG